MAQRTGRGGMPREEEVKEAGEAMTETISHGLQQGKQMLESAVHDGGDKMLALALLMHAVINGWQGSCLLFSPEMILPSFFGGFAGKLMEQFEKLNINVHAPNPLHGLLRAFGLQTVAMALIAGGAAFRYDTKHKAILNAVLLFFHLVTTGDLLWNKWGSAEKSAFRVGPGFFHVPMIVAHSLALLAYAKPEGFFGGGRTSGRGASSTGKRRTA